MADEKPFEWSKDFILCWRVSQAVKRGGLSADERRALAKEFSVSEDLLLRCERAEAAWDTQIFHRYISRARVEAMRLLKERGQDPCGPDLWTEASEAFRRILDALPEPEKGIVRELKESRAAIKAALGVSISTCDE